MATSLLTRRERLVLALQRTTDKLLTRPFGWIYRRTHGRIAELYGVRALLLTTAGRRTGRPRTVVLQYFLDGQDMIVAAANDGGRTDPAWFHNLSADPRAVVEVGTTRSEVVAEVLAEDEAREWWARILQVAPTYERYERATSRRIPIVRLVRANP
jgi:deazaflavin-dependent oxidoreductase (nitroreductase family)